MAEEPNSSSSSTLPRNDIDGSRKPRRSRRFEHKVSTARSMSKEHLAQAQPATNNVRFERDTIREYLQQNSTNKPPGLQWWPPNLRLGRSGLCTPCRAIDFEAAFTTRRPLEHEAGQRWIHIHEQDIQSFDQTERNSEGIEWPVNDNCQLCRYLANAAPTSPKKGEYTLVFHNECQPHHNEVLIEVLPFSLSLRQYRGLASVFGRFSRYSFDAMRSASNTIICHRNKPFRKAGTPQIVSPVFDSSLAQSWFDICKLEHQSECGAEDDTPIPKTMLIDCNTRRLVSMDSDCKPRPRFIALSYVWGPNKKPQDQAPTTDGLSIDLPLDLPLTINDAITVTKALGFQYLWVDQYCIDQNNKKDEHRQILQMDIVYKCADLTIIAAAGDGCDYGLPGVSTCRRDILDPFVLDDVFTFGIHPREDRQYWKKGSWHTRGWTFQEALLARRLLIFSDTGTYYECRSHTEGAWQSELWGGVECADCEDLRETPLSKRRRNVSSVIQSVVGSTTLSSRGSALDKYTELVTQYTTRNLSYAKDALNAFRGAANALQQTLRGVHPVYSINGIPFVVPRQAEAEDGLVENCFLYGLAWRSTAGSVAPSPIFPSWSWANVRVWGVTWASIESSLWDNPICQAHAIHIEFELHGNEDWLFEDSDNSAQRADFLFTQGRKKLYALAEFAKAFRNLTPLSRFKRNPTALCFTSRILCSRFTRDKPDHDVYYAGLFRGIAYSDLGHGTLDIAVHIDALHMQDKSDGAHYVHGSQPRCLTWIPNERLCEEIASERCGLVLLRFDSEEAWVLLVEWLGGEADGGQRTARRAGFLKISTRAVYEWDQHLENNNFLRCFSIETDLRLI